jgi:hypothetical protein
MSSDKMPYDETAVRSKDFNKAMEAANLFSFVVDGLLKGTETKQRRVRKGRPPKTQDEISAEKREKAKRKMAKASRKKNRK